MLTRLEIDGFKTFEDLDISFSPFTVILGSNAAGKSNLFDAIKLLSNLATKDVNEALKDMRGEPLELFRQTPTQGRVRQISLAAEVMVDPLVRDPWGSEFKLTHTRMRYEVTLERRETKRGLERIQIAKEAAYPVMSKDDRWVKAQRPTKAFRDTYLRYGRQTPWLTTQNLPQGLSFSIHQDGQAGRNRPAYPAGAAEATVLYSMANADFHHLFALREEMRNWRLLQLDPALLRKPAPAAASDVLDVDGANLAAVLARLKAETATSESPNGVLSDIAAELSSLIPGVTQLDAGLHDASREYRIELTMRDGLPYTSRVISDGTLRVLALLTLLNDPQHRGLICFEEPENGVHPGRVRQLVRRLNDMVSTPAGFASDEEGAAPLCQLLLNSHSPVVLSALLDQNPGDPPLLDAEILFADTATVVDPDLREQRRKTRLRPVVRPGSVVQADLFDALSVPQGQVSSMEVNSVLGTVSAEG